MLWAIVFVQKSGALPGLVASSLDKRAVRLKNDTVDLTNGSGRHSATGTLLTTMLSSIHF